MAQHSGPIEGLSFFNQLEVAIALVDYYDLA